MARGGDILLTEGAARAAGDAAAAAEGRQIGLAGIEVAYRRLRIADED